MKLWIPFATAAGVFVAAAILFGADWDMPPVDTEQIGYRGTGMVLIKDREKQEDLRLANVAPEPLYEADPEGDRAGDVYENVQVLGGLSDDQFNLFMASITEWVSPEQGCAYCHNEENLASDEVYTKVVARRMIQMTQAINQDWQPHVAETGVTCYTCHQGQPVPANVWSRDLGPGEKGRALGWRDGQNVVSELAGVTSLPSNALESYLLEDEQIRVHSLTALPNGENTATTKETESTWALMMHMSESLGANCMTCHNSRAFNDWDQSPPQRVTAWHGIRMARDINQTYMIGLAPVFPDNRKGPEGDVLKVSCATCHNGVQKPLYGVSMLKDYLDSLGVKTNTDVPDYTTYTPGETQIMGPAKTTSLEPVSGMGDGGKALASAD
ncbi:MAG: photosynthetic reaction center cytochrome c subunit [Hoeflea sp.]|uniref:photosynthetic reaction center cytochrome PufC n=1 Tax=Hoeflea sp. TaxID=1940281 RepID=UPI001DC73D4B|nr:photosynthetic reaction center cytochrome PufC [Hoeflea sp.]MBU4527847.1 photosynthetic reaction center cytochrome c subunit [Alphaproteobacteria bacterium]MBU4546118.1 photosynthetic reaction center cytochrome c subunit [Alphaproteobacteria bacterium]MBU4553197.1 photosynthetic reaction center cytochrome c subunit [Alphaproteobacteria bacterium]MBV1724269.1 photosynthetic reaction center cytochrome c subunit [Hoeflea sp.]MBV1759954.1 photosynthetic reaction center cytochrome c subunit [Hoe